MIVLSWIWIRGLRVRSFPHLPFLRRESRVCYPASAIPRLLISRRDPRVCDSCVCSPASHFQNPRPLENIPLLSFPIFSLPSLNADLTYLGFCIYCEDPPHVAFIALQNIPSSHYDFLSPLLNAAFGFPPKRDFNPCVWPILA